MAVDVVPRRVRRISWRLFAFGLFVLVCLLAVLVLTLRPAPTADTPVRAVDLYVSAREQGDRDAMATVLDGNAGVLAERLSEVDGRPVDVTDVNITRSDISDVMYTVTVTWSDAGHRVSTDRLLVMPREGGDPSAPLDWSVSVAP